MNSRASQRNILWATTIVSASTLSAVIVGVVRNKIVAVVGGPEAIGLLGAYTALLATIGGVATFGLDYSSVRLLSPLIGDPKRAPEAKLSIWMIAFPLAIIGGAAMLLFRAPLADFATGSSRWARDVGWLGLGVIASVCTAVQMAIIQASGNVKTAARIRFWGSVLAAFPAVIAVLLLGLQGIVVAALCLPLVTVFLTAFARDARIGLFRPTRSVAKKGTTLLAAGAMVALTQAVGSFSGLGGRAIVAEHLGLAEAGVYQAANAIVTMNVTLLLNAIAADYFPRASRSNNLTDAGVLVNDQLRVMLVFAAPALLMIVAAAPLLLGLLYSSKFVSGALLLRLFAIGSAIRVTMWVLSFTLLAKGWSAAYFSGEAAGTLFVLVTWILVPMVGLNGAGCGAIVGVAASLAVYAFLLNRKGVHVSSDNWLRLAQVTGALAATTVAFEIHPWVGLASAGACLSFFLWRAIHDYRLLMTETEEGA